MSGTRTRGPFVLATGDTVTTVLTVKAKNGLKYTYTGSTEGTGDIIISLATQPGVATDTYYDAVKVNKYGVVVGGVEGGGGDVSDYQADWDVTDATKRTYIANKPTIPVPDDHLVYVKNGTSTTSKDLVAAVVGSGFVTTGYNSTDDTLVVKLGTPSTAGFLAYSSSASAWVIDTSTYVTPTALNTALGSYLQLSAGAADALTGTLYAQSITPAATTTYDLGTSAIYWNNLYVKTITASGNVTCNSVITAYVNTTAGSIHFQSSGTDIAVFTSGSFTYTGHLLPATTATYNLGSTSLYWATTYSNAVNVAGVGLWRTYTGNSSYCMAYGANLTPANANYSLGFDNVGNTTWINASNNVYIQIAGTNVVGVASGNITAYGTISPSTSTTYSLGNSSSRWNVAYLATVNASTSVVVNSTTRIDASGNGYFTSLTDSGLTQYALTYASTSAGLVSSLGTGTSGQMLVSSGSSAAPAWKNVTISTSAPTGTPGSSDYLWLVVSS